MSEEDIANALMSVNDCLQVIGQRLDAIEQYVQELPIHDKICLLYTSPSPRD